MCLGRKLYLTPRSPNSRGCVSELTLPGQAFRFLLLAPLLCDSDLFVVGRTGRQYVGHVDHPFTDGRLGKVLIEVRP